MDAFACVRARECVCMCVFVVHEPNNENSNNNFPKEWDSSRHLIEIRPHRPFYRVLFHYYMLCEMVENFSVFIAIAAANTAYAALLRCCCCCCKCYSYCYFEKKNCCRHIQMIFHSTLIFDKMLSIVSDFRRFTICAKFHFQLNCNESSV